MSFYVKGARFPLKTGASMGKGFAALGDSMAKVGDKMKKLELINKKDKALKSKELAVVSSLRKTNPSLLESYSDEEVLALSNGSFLGNLIKTKDEAKAKRDIVSAMRLKHPKTTKDMSDDQIFQYTQNAGNAMKYLKESGTKYKKVDSIVDKDNNRFLVYDTGEVDDTGAPVIKKILVGTQKDWQAPASPKSDSKNLDIINKKALEKAKEIRLRREKKDENRSTSLGNFSLKTDLDKKDIDAYFELNK